ncbi:MAG TPA: hypothetical protein VNO20_09940 [Solirubrobacterales bacterium]|nr:hypothetical protein [Solirubrobacterales bacterium]
MSKRSGHLLLAITLAFLAMTATPASAAFGLKEVDVTFTNEDGSTATQAGSHPFAMTTSLSFNTALDPIRGYEIPDGQVRNLAVLQGPGLIGEPKATPRCANIDFLNPGGPLCADSTAIGVADVEVLEPGTVEHVPVYNIEPPPGVAQKIGFSVISVPVTIDLGVSESPPYNVLASLRNIPQAVSFYGSEVTLWGNPADPVHDAERGSCARSNGSCPASVATRPYLTLPRACEGPLSTTFKAASWRQPADLSEASALTHDDVGNPLGMTGCSKLGFSPSITAQPTSKAAQSPSGLDFSLDVADEGITNPTGLAQSDIKETVVTLPEGFTTNPSIAEGLEVCTEAQLAKETAKSPLGTGCPSASKIGTVEVETPLLDEQVNGSLFIAKPYENPFDSLLALYIVIKNANLGIVVKQPLEVIPDPVTGQLTTVAEDLPQLPFSHFRLHFREGARSPLATPPACGKYDVEAELVPWSGGAPVTTTSTFEVITGPGEGPCPPGGLPPFKPGLLAGTINNRAGSYSPFNLRLSRSDGEQEFTRFSIKLPPGITGKLAGIPYCPDAAIEAAKQRTGTEEEASPSCPAASEVGRTLAGAGVGPSPAYAPGKIYLAGPFNGSPLSIAAITAAKVGPFDLGTVVVRQALKIDRNTAEVFIDATGSDPIPHIIDGIVVHARDIRAYVDKPEFMLNPTSCERTSTASTLLGSGLDFASEADNNPVVVSTPFQAADCASLPFDPKLGFRLIGGTKRGAHPKLRAVLRMAPGQANISRARVTLPRSAFLDQSHIRTVCTRVQYAAKQCPPASIYGYAKATTPLFETPVEGPIYLRSSSNKLPDLVAALKNGQIEFDLVGRIDSLKGRIRNTFDFVPDAPVSEAVFTFQGAAKGLITNSTNLCKGTHRAIAEFGAHNGRLKNFRPVVGAKCKGKGRKAKRPAH